MAITNDYIKETSLNGIITGVKGDRRSGIDKTLLQIVKNLCIIAFEWKGLPKEIPNFIMEALLFEYGQVSVFEYGGHPFALKCAPNGNLDVYGRYSKVKPIGVNGAEFPNVYVLDSVTLVDDKIEKHGKNAVLVWNNYERTSTLDILMPFIQKLSYIWDSMAINEALSRCKLIYSSTQNQKSSLKKELNKLFNGIDAVSVVTDKNFLDGLTKVETGTNANDINPLWYDFDKTFSLLLTILGINNNQNNEKAERMIVDEVNANNQLIEQFKNSMLLYRQKAAEEMNELFSWGVEVVPYGSQEEEYEEYEEYEEIEEQEEQKPKKGFFGRFKKNKEA